MVELRKRPARVEPEARPAKKASTPTAKADKADSKSGPAKKAAATASKLKEKVTGKSEEAAPAATAAAEDKEGEQQKAVESTEKSPAAAPAPTKTAKAASGASLAKGDVIDVDTFGGEVETHDGKKVTLKQLLEESKSGVVLFTYPKANTPGCTTQACAFRDGHETLTGGGLEIYGLSGDSPKSNTTFKTKQNLPYTLLCNPSYSLIGAIGLQQGSDKKTKRGVFAVDKSGKVLLSFAGGPIPTVDAVKKLVDELEKA